MLTVRVPPDGQHAFGPVTTSSQKTARNITTNLRTFVQNLFPIASPPASGQSPFRSRCPCWTALTPFPCPSFSHKAIRLCGSPCGGVANRLLCNSALFSPSPLAEGLLHYTTASFFVNFRRSSAHGVLCTPWALCAYWWVCRSSCSRCFFRTRLI